MQRFAVFGEGFRPQDAPGTGAENLGELELNSPEDGEDTLTGSGGNAASLPDHLLAKVLTTHPPGA